MKDRFESHPLVKLYSLADEFVSCQVARTNGAQLRVPGGYDIMAGILQPEGGRLRAELTDFRAKFKYAGNKGAVAEHEFRKFLRRYMPGDTRVGHGEVFEKNDLRCTDGVERAPAGVERPVLDGLFVANRRILMHMGTGKGKLVIKGEDGQSLTGYVGFTRDGGVLTHLLVWTCGVLPMTIRFRHPVFPYLQRSSESGTRWLNDQGSVERRPPRPPAAAPDGTVESEGA